MQSLNDVLKSEPVDYGIKRRRCSSRSRGSVPSPGSAARVRKSLSQKIGEEISLYFDERGA